MMYSVGYDKCTNVLTGSDLLLSTVVTNPVESFSLRVISHETLFLEAKKLSKRLS